jgi:hypothetical protein
MVDEEGWLNSKAKEYLLRYVYCCRLGEAMGTFSTCRQQATEADVCEPYPEL